MGARRQGLAAGALAVLLLLGQAGTAVATQGQIACRAPLQSWTQIELHLGRDINSGGMVSERAFLRFVDEVVTPRFPDGLGIIDFVGQYRHSHGTIVREPSKLLTILVPDPAAVAGKVHAIIRAYKRRFQQESVLHTELPVCVAFR
ncbi:MAG: DUF3574 domain-containing protein [Geminicoccaceae bacterium]